MGRAATVGLAVLAVSLTLAARASASSLSPVALQTDAATELLGTDDPKPRLEWRLTSPRRGAAQSGYRVLVASSPGLLEPGKADLWDSGRMRSTAPWVEYGGQPLRSRTRYFWTVRVWDERDGANGYAPATWFETAFMNPTEWRADWIAGQARPSTVGADGLVDDATMQTEGEFCRPVGPPGALTLTSGPQRDEYLGQLQGACRAVRPAPLLRREFPLDGRITRARLYVSGLAYADVYLNGERLGERTVLDPGYTDYAKTDLYVTHDVTDRLRTGRNALGVELGSGFYDYDVPSEWSWTQADWRGDPRLRLELHVQFADGRSQVVRSDESWKAIDGPTRYDNIQIGETYDARFARPGWNRPGFDDTRWTAARTVGPPGGEPAAQTHEPIAIVGTREPVAVTQPRPGVRVYDLGEQLTGWAEIEIEAPSGQAAELAYGETLLPDGTVDTTRNLHVGDRLQTDFVVAGESGPVRWRPRFSYKGFRYVQVSGPRGTPFAGRVRDLEVQAVRSSVRPTAAFRSDNALVNDIFGLVRRAISNNLHGIVTDTPVYEKNGWTGDAQLTAPTAATLFDMRRFYRKWLRDMRDSQYPSGEIPVIVPSGERYGYTGVGWDAAWGATPAWDAAMFLIPWEVYERYGDERLLEDTYAAMRLYVDRWIPQWAEGHIVDAGLGDHLSPASTDGIGLIGAAGLTKLVSTAYYAEFVKRLAALADMVGDTARRDRYRRLHAEIRDAFNATFFDEEEGIYRESDDAGFLQTANVLPLAFDLVPDDRRAGVAAAIARDVEANGGNLMTGIVGTRYILEELTKAGMVDVAFGIATQTDNPSWGEWVKLAYTSLPENWGRSIRSLDHHMFASIGQWFFEDLAGVEPLRPGYAEIEFRPEVPSKGLDAVHMSLDSVRGRVATSWRKTEGGFALDVVVPAGSTGRVHVPAARPADVSEVGLDRVPADGAEGVRLAGAERGRVVYEVGSGAYRFRVGGR